MTENFIAYLLDGGNSKKHENSFVVGATIEKVLELFENETSSSYEEGVEEKQEADEKLRDGGPVGFEAILDRAFNLSLSQVHLIMIAAASRPIFRGSVAEFQVLSPVKKQAFPVETHEDYVIYGLTNVLYHDLMIRMKRLKSMDEALGDLPGTVLMGLVATFDAFIADVVREILGRYPERYTSSEKEVRVKDVLLHGSFEEFKYSMIDDDVYNFTRGSHEEQIKFIEKNFEIPIQPHWKRYSDFIEIFERRNLIAHGERRFNQKYLKICTAAGYKAAADNVGKKINLNIKYLRQAADILAEFAVVLSFRLWRKHDKETEGKAFEKINAVIFELIQNDRFAPAVAIANAVLDVKSNACTQLDRGMITINLASAYKHMKQEEAAKKALKSIDWSASADNFQICVASLNEDFDTIEALMPKVAAGQSIEADSFRTWPVFSFVRKNGRFERAFEQAFGEPLVRAPKATSKAVEAIDDLENTSSSLTTADSASTTAPDTAR